MLRVLYQVSNLIAHCCTNLNQNDLNIQLHTIPGWSIRGPRQHQNNYFIKCLCLHLEKEAGAVVQQVAGGAPSQRPSSST